MGMEFGIIVKKTIDSVLEVSDDVFESLWIEEIKSLFNVHGSILAALKQLANTRGPKKVNHMTLEAYEEIV